MTVDHTYPNFFNVNNIVGIFAVVTTLIISLHILKRKNTPPKIMSSNKTPLDGTLSIFVILTGHNDNQFEKIHDTAQTLFQIFHHSDTPCKINVLVIDEYFDEIVKYYDSMVGEENLNGFNINIHQSMSKFNNEKFTMTLQGGIQLVKKWDVKCISMLSDLSHHSYNSILTTLPSFNQKVITYMRIMPNLDSKIKVLTGYYEHTPTQYYNSSLWTHYFSFSFSHMLNFIDMYQNCDVFNSFNLWKNGWNFYNPNQCIIYTNNIQYTSFNQTNTNIYPQYINLLGVSNNCKTVTVGSLLGISVNRVSSYDEIIQKVGSMKMFNKLSLALEKNIDHKQK